MSVSNDSTSADVNPPQFKERDTASYEFLANQTRIAINQYWEDHFAKNPEAMANLRRTLIPRDPIDTDEHMKVKWIESLKKQPASLATNLTLNFNNLDF